MSRGPDGNRGFFQGPAVDPVSPSFKRGNVAFSGHLFLVQVLNAPNCFAGLQQESARNALQWGIRAASAQWSVNLHPKGVTSGSLSRAVGYRQH
jgi:hypothetical protein